MFERVTLRGGQAMVLWGYRTAATLTRWTIQKQPGGRWRLSGTIARADGFQLRQRPLIFSAPRAGGFWCWPIETIQVGPNQVVAQLGLPEQ